MPKLGEMASLFYVNKNLQKLHFEDLMCRSVDFSGFY